mmetsp:Transcript_9489/g.11793  ORF Transcript_9489/g.11793 Transcript_9489/m.11793 type:complete len:216 (-) Transcript_9489:157-804(-)
MLVHKQGARKHRKPVYLRRRDSESDEDESQRPVPKQKSMREASAKDSNINKKKSEGLTTKEKFALALEGKLEISEQPGPKLTRRHSRILDDLLETYGDSSELGEDMEAAVQREEEEQKKFYEKLHSDSYTEKKRQEKLQKMAAERQKILDDLEKELEALNVGTESSNEDSLKKIDTNASTKSKKSLKVKRTSTTNTNSTDDTLIGKVVSFVSSWF